MSSVFTTGKKPGSIICVSSHGGGEQDKQNTSASSIATSSVSTLPATFQSDVAITLPNQTDKASPLQVPSDCAPKLPAAVPSQTDKAPSLPTQSDCASTPSATPSSTYLISSGSDTEMELDSISSDTSRMSNSGEGQRYIFTLHVRDNQLILFCRPTSTRDDHLGNGAFHTRVEDGSDIP